MSFFSVGGLLHSDFRLKLFMLFSSFHQYPLQQYFPKWVPLNPGFGKALQGFGKL